MNSQSLAVALALALIVNGTCLSQQAPTLTGQPWMNASLAPDLRADMVLKQLTLDEKIQLVHGIGWGPLVPGSPIPPDNNGGAGEVMGIPRLGIPSLQQADSAVGIRMAAQQSRYATLLPSVLAAASSWDTEAAHLYGDVIGRELRAQGFNQSIGGGVNLARDPRNGRLFEYAGEDPVLAGVTVGHVIRGVQDNHIMGDIKHYALNDQETGRTVVDARISKKAARESDLLAFELGIRIGQPSSVMCSYNKVMGDWACENEWLLNHVLKGAWHFPGFVVSDWDGTHSTEKAAMAGLDMQMPGEEYFGEALKQAVTAGRVPLRRLDDMVHRLLRSMFSAGVIDHPPIPRSVIDPFRGLEDAQHIAEESIVLLKNDGTLPLNLGAVHSIAVIGAHADVGVLSGGGSAQVDAPGGNAISPTTPTKWGEAVYFPSPPLRYIREHARGAVVQFNDGTNASAAAALAKTADVAIVFADQYMSEAGDAPSLSLPDGQDELISSVAAANPHTLVVLITGNPVTMPWLDRVAGVMEAWYPGIAGGQAIANLIFGSVVPSGKLPITFAKSAEDLPHRCVFGIACTQALSSPRHWVSDDAKRQSFAAEYDEGVRFGYKWFDSEGKQPLFPFGFGLSYTKFKYSDLQVDRAAKTVTFAIENTGGLAGTEIAEIYVELPKAGKEHFRRLAAWQRVALDSRQRKTVTVALEPLAMATFNEQKDAWTWTSGKYTVLVGGSSRDLPLRAGIALY
ncbi:MAG TPA: glycoside hydrolase family 3 C-terminal domain-containing protein [Steroidobacteraceae bacterium]|nr:glycoside hydrolase family 3 C-terminal domain-containing protein [Steroidobacteraceae bacterium]